MLSEGCLRLNEHVNFSHQNNQHVHDLIIRPRAAMGLSMCFLDELCNQIAV